MRGTLIGSDYLKQGNDVKFLELNTNIAIHKEATWLDTGALMSLLTSSNITEFHFIYPADNYQQYPINDSFGEDANYVFGEQISSSCALHNITYTSHEVVVGAITVPYIEDGDNKFILRQSYDNTAIIDSSYAADNFEFFDLMSGSNFLPKVYQSSSVDELYTDTLDSLDTNSPHPNAVVKSRYPGGSSNLKVYKFTDTSSIGSDLNDLKSNLDEDYAIQEFVKDDSNIVSGSWSVIRGIDILYGNNLDVLHLGGYKQASYLELNDWNITYSGSSQVLDKRSQILYNNKPYSTSENFFHTDEETLVLKSDGSLASGSDLVIGDEIKSLVFDFEYGVERNGTALTESIDTLNHYGYISDITGSIQYVTSSLSEIRVTTEDIPMINITLNDGTVLSDSPRQHFLIEESGSDLTYFEYVNYFKVGDKMCYLDKDTNNITTKEITSLDVTWGNPSLNIYNLDFEPNDYYLSHNSGSQYLIIHNPCNGCNSWASCGTYWCDNGCSACSNAFERVKY